MRVRIGVDGGATKTECILAGESGRVLARHLAPGCSPSHLGPRRAAGVVRRALRDLRSKAPRAAVETTLLCLAGNRAFWGEFAASLRGFGRVLAVDDSFPILELAAGDGPGLVLHAGTGSFVAARAAAGADDFTAGAAYAGGLGWRFGDPGSGYDLGCRAVARVLLEWQGWLPPSGLGRLLRAHTGLRDAGALSRRYYGSADAAFSPNADLARLAPGVLRLAQRGDCAARQVVEESVGGLLDLAVRVAARLFPRRPRHRLAAGLSGPILNHPAAAAMLARRSPFRLKAIAEPPIEGVRRMLSRLPGNGSAT